MAEVAFYEEWLQAEVCKRNEADGGDRSPRPVSAFDDQSGAISSKGQRHNAHGRRQEAPKVVHTVEHRPVVDTERSVSMRIDPDQRLDPFPVHPWFYQGERHA